MKRSGLPRYVVMDTRRNGTFQLRYRAPGKPSFDLPTPYGSDAFWLAYSAAREGRAPTLADRPGRSPQAATGSLRWLVEAYYRSASDFVGGEILTQKDKRGVLEGMLRETLAPDNPLLFENCPITSFRPQHVVALRDRKAALPNAANKRLRYLKLLFDWAVEAGHADANPVERVKKLKVPQKGFHAWTPEEVRQYENTHAVGSKARLALALMAYTGLRVSDLSRLGRQHTKDGWLSLPQHKNRTRAPKTISIPILPELQTILDRSPLGELTFLVTEARRPFTIKGLANKFKDWCIEAGLDHCSAHGVRKASATVAAENGATEAQLMAIYGWENAKEAVRYTRSANKKKLAGEAMHLTVPRVK